MIQLNYRDSRPIYEQIKDGLKRLVMTGVLSTDEKLPSVRELASQLAINPNTISKAYRELEQEGYIYTVAGKGSFAADKREVSNARNKKLLQDFNDIVKELLYLGEDASDLQSRIDRIRKDGESLD